MFKVDRIHRQRRWLAAVTLGATLLLLGTGTTPSPTTPCRTRPAHSRRRPRRTRSPATPSRIPAKATPKDLAVAVDAVAQAASHSYFSINFVWTLVAGFLVMFMQAGFALVETGLIRAKNAAHTMSMNFMVYALGMFGFFVCGFAFMCGGSNGTAIGGPGDARAAADAGLACSPSARRVNGDHGWGLFGTTGFFLTGKATTPPSSCCSSS